MEDFDTNGGITEDLEVVVEKKIPRGNGLPRCGNNYKAHAGGTGQRTCVPDYIAGGGGGAGGGNASSGLAPGGSGGAGIQRCYGTSYYFAGGGGGGMLLVQMVMWRNWWQWRWRWWSWYWFCGWR